MLLAALLFFPSSSVASEKWHVTGAPAAVQRTIRFSNGGATLVGTLYEPAAVGRFPAVVVLHGAANGTRGDALYDHLRTGLPAMGFAVLIYDRRGSGQSSGSLTHTSYEALADDAIAGSRDIAARPEIDARRIGYWGLSQGGWLALLATSRDPKAAFCVAVSTPLVTPESQMEFAMTNLMSVRGFSQSDIQQMLNTRKAWTGYLSGTMSRTQALGAIRAVETKPWFHQVYIPSSSKLTSDPAHSSWRLQMNEDFTSTLRRIRVPVLFIYGGEDPWIPVADSVTALKSIAATHHNIQFVVIADADHEMMITPHVTMNDDPKSEQLYAPAVPEYFMLLSAWLAQQK
jgi:pimeloyl-ACP methyl ester carboxylesterase